MTQNSRPWQAPDLPAMIEVLTRWRMHRPVDTWLTASELRVLLSSPDQHWDGRVWTDRRGELAGYTLVGQPWGTIIPIVDPFRGEHSIEREMVQWGLDELRQSPTPDVQARWQIRDDDAHSTILATDLGFRRSDLHTVRLARDLRQPIPTPQLPDGFTVRPVTGESEILPYFTLHRMAFGTEEMTVSDRLAFMRDSAYRPELDMVVVAPDGDLVAFCVGACDEEDNAGIGKREGWTDPVGTHPAFRRKGLAAAAVVATLARLRQLGMETALTGTRSWNEAASALFQSAGYRKLYNVLWYIRQSGDG